MDTSTEYIKMCEKAKEIQKSKPSLTNGGFNELLLNEVGYCKKHKRLLIKDGNRFIVCPEMEELTNEDIVDPAKLCFDYAGNWIWLPRQDQLQGMMKDITRINNPISISFDMYFWVEEFKEYLTIRTDGMLSKLRFVSMEQLWLAFVMKEKYRKIWNPEKEEWVDENSKSIQTNSS